MAIPACNKNIKDNKAAYSFRKFPTEKVPAISARRAWSPISLTIDVFLETPQGPVKLKGELDCDCNSSIIHPRIVQKYNLKKWKTPII